MAIRRRILVRGIVQGIGFRPHIFQQATAFGLAGFVGNNSEGAFLEVEGAGHAVEAFLEALRQSPPPLASIHSIDWREIPALGETRFRIVASQAGEDRSTPISPDVAVCPDCLAELNNPSDRRFGYPFINCTNCGPRFTIIQDIPYDRPHTTMHVFPMCAACQAEYDDPANRRFHAQPNACWECGPTVWLQRVADGEVPDPRALPHGSNAIRAACDLLRAGAVLAVKGIGGFHLACDATSDAAVNLLRERKGRVGKPFAVMAASVEQARGFVEISDREEMLLRGVAHPIVLLARRQPPALRIAEGVAPGQDTFGVMLPYTPLHHLLIGDRPLVMTSGNRSDEPIVRDNAEALARLAPLADAFLLHNREIHVVADDSVTRVIAGREMPLRRSRGYAPMPVRLPNVGPSVLAVGAELKATFCLTRDNYAYLSQHIGDLGNLETQSAFERALDHFLTIFRVTPEAIACDMHPGYLSTVWAKQQAQALSLPLLEIQHHHAHLAALRGEHGFPGDAPLLGIVFDGTGYGEDGAIWGGEFLLLKGDDCRRLAHLRYVPLPGGDAAIRHPWRAALAHLHAAGLQAPGLWNPASPETMNVVTRQLQRNLNCFPTSSAGRLFDAVASIAGIRHSVTYEAQAAMEMEALCVPDGEAAPYPFDLLEGDPLRLCPAPMWHALVHDIGCGTEAAVIAARFHEGLAFAAAGVCARLREIHAVQTVGLSGGVFQNALFLSRCLHHLQASGFQVLVHQSVPASDGGLALGQALLARQRLPHLA